MVCLGKSKIKLCLVEAAVIFGLDNWTTTTGSIPVMTWAKPIDMQRLWAVSHLTPSQKGCLWLWNAKGPIPPLWGWSSTNQTHRLEVGRGRIHDNKVVMSLFTWNNKGFSHFYEHKAKNYQTRASLAKQRADTPKRCLVSQSWACTCSENVRSQEKRDRQSDLIWVPGERKERETKEVQSFLIKKI